jgi:hypothetical protein
MKTEREWRERLWTFSAGTYLPASFLTVCGGRRSFERLPLSLLFFLEMQVRNLYNSFV